MGPYRLGARAVSIDVWSADDAGKIRLFLFEEVARAIRLGVERVNQRGIELNAKPLERALEKVKRLYLARPISKEPTPPSKSARPRRSTYGAPPDSTL